MQLRERRREERETQPGVNWLRQDTHINANLFSKKFLNYFAPTWSDVFQDCESKLETPAIHFIVVWLWQEASTMHFGSCRFSSVWHKKTLSAFFLQTEGSDFKIIITHFYYISNLILTTFICPLSLYRKTSSVCPH